MPYYSICRDLESGPTLENYPYASETTTEPLQVRPRFSCFGFRGLGSGVWSSGFKAGSNNIVAAVMTIRVGA